MPIDSTCSYDPAKHEIAVGLYEMGVEVFYTTEDIDVRKCVEAAIVEILNLKIVDERDIALPDWLFDQRRKQYRAEEVLDYIATLRKYEKTYVFGVIDADGYVKGLNFVFGVAYPHMGAVVFLQRLKTQSKELFLLRTRKEVLHELGHVLGLEHCKQFGCVMNFSNSVYEVDMKRDAFCKKCASKLSEFGVVVNPRHVLI